MSLKRVVFETIESAAEEIPLVKTINKTLVAVGQRRHKRLGAEFLRHVSTLLAMRDATQTGSVVLEKLHQESAADAVDRGYRAILESVDPWARACIAALVADYVYTARAPDRTYRRAANLFADLTADEIPALQVIVGTSIRVLKEAVDDSVTMIKTVRADSPTGRIWTRVDEAYFEDETFPLPAGFIGAVQCLLRHGFAREPSSSAVSMADTHHQYAAFDRDAVEALRVLASCLAVLPPGQKRSRQGPRIRRPRPSP